MSGLAEFLLARIAEDEKIARDAPGPTWHVAIERTGSPGHWRGIGAYLVTLHPSNRFGSLSVGEEIARSNGPRPFTVDHIERHDPARVLAECEAKAAIVNYYQLCSPSEDIALTTVMRHLVSVYDGHPDFDKRWML